MVHSRWPIRVASTYVALTFVAWAMVISNFDSELGLKLALVLALPWSLLQAESTGTTTVALVVFGEALLDASLLYVALRYVMRQNGPSQRGSAAA